MAARARIEGRVQGVGFREWTRTQARALGLRGWVRNLPDGAVEWLAEGPEAAIDALAEASRRGPPAARVTTVQVAPAAPAPLPEGARSFA